MEPLPKDPEDLYLSVFTRILPINADEIGTFSFSKADNYLAPWTFTPSTSDSGANLLTAADALQTTLYPVAFPTETVYGLGANAISSSAVKGIYRAKQRPSDNPLIVHISSLEMLRRLLDPLSTHEFAGTDPIPRIYVDLITEFWPGPLSILLPNTKGSRIAEEVTAGQPTFAARMPNNPLALALIQLSHLPLAAPSANTSTKPSPTTAQHVANDLAGRIEIILDGGPCTVGVESTVVDGLCLPPVILRPGGIGIEQIRQIKGWENVVVGYKDAPSLLSESSTEPPRAPGMKYKHYSPTARVVLAELHVHWDKVWSKIQHDVKHAGAKPISKIGIIKTKEWPAVSIHNGIESPQPLTPTAMDIEGTEVQVFSLDIGHTTATVARGLFSALRDLDSEGVQVIYVEGISDVAVGYDDGVEMAVAVMNRLRKAATERVMPEHVVSG